MPKGDKSNFKIYAHINKSNGKIYIGQTCMFNPNYRWRDGKGYEPDSYFGRAIQKYGWDNFIHLIVIDHLSLDEANLFEEELIKKYKTTDRRYGYNIAFGGENYRLNDNTKEKLRQINMGKKYSIQTKEKHREITKAQWDNGLRKGHKMSEEQLHEYGLTRGKPVCQYDKYTLELLAEYVSEKEAERQTGIPQRSIARACLNPDGVNQSVKGYVWRFKGDAPSYRNTSEKKEIVQCDKNTGQLMHIYSCSGEAAKAVGVDRSSIVKCCNGKQQTCAGYKWYFSKDYNRRMNNELL